MIWAVWRWIATSRAGRAAAVVLAALAGIWAYGRRKHSQGENEAEQEMRNADYERADQIRRRARDADGNGVQPNDKRGFRD